MTRLFGCFCVLIHDKLMCPHFSFSVNYRQGTASHFSQNAIKLIMTEHLRVNFRLVTIEVDPLVHILQPCGFVRVKALVAPLKKSRAVEEFLKTFRYLTYPFLEKIRVFFLGEDWNFGVTIVVPLLVVVLCFHWRLGF